VNKILLKGLTLLDAVCCNPLKDKIARLKTNFPDVKEILSKTSFDKIKENRTIIFTLHSNRTNDYFKLLSDIHQKKEECLHFYLT
jgi:hypothetical protein